MRPLPSLLVLGAAVLAGCGESGRVAYYEIIDREQFRAAGVRPTPVDPSASTELIPSETTGPLAASEGLIENGVFTVVAIPGPPRTEGTEPGIVSETGVDEVVGYVNGRPIRASDFFEADGKGPRYAQMAKDRPRAQWLGEVEKDIAESLLARIRSELIVAEASGSLSKEERQGLFSIIESLQRDKVRESGGSRTLAEQRVLEGAPEGSLDEWLRTQKDTALVRYWMSNQIEPRVQVSLRDMRLFYEQNPKLFSPPATAYFRIIDVKESRTEAVERVRSSLASGEPFAEVAAGKDNQLAADIRTREWTSTFDGSYEKAAHFAGALINDEAVRLLPGQWVGPIRADGLMRWVYLDRINRRSIPFEDAQIWISERLKDSRTEQELRRYFDELAERGQFSDYTGMVRRLTTIATQRFNPPKSADALR